MSYFQSLSTIFVCAHILVLCNQVSKKENSKAPTLTYLYTSTGNTRYQPIFFLAGLDGAAADCADLGHHQNDG